MKTYIMRLYILLIICNIILTKVTAQSFQFINNTKSSVLTNKYFFYTSTPDTSLNRLVNFELGSLSAFFFIKPACYYYDSLITFSKELVKPNFQDDNVYLDLNLLNKETSQTLKNNNIIIILTHQFAWIIAKKYKLNLSFLQQILFTDYISGSYIGNKHRFLKKKENYYDSQSFYLSFGDDASDYLTKEYRIYSFQKGETDFLNAYQKRRVYTLRDIISEGINFVMSQDLQ
ncbi:hypothetical protein [Mucilaginibacter sp.]|uniref:hypothetical protein n=1 Tax=Mucilaginibacter sp. TaxID=1882438 RepID=UPI00356999A6